MPKFGSRTERMMSTRRRSFHAKRWKSASGGTCASARTTAARRLARTASWIFSCSVGRGLVGGYAAASPRTATVQRVEMVAAAVAKIQTGTVRAGATTTTTG
uniref:(northern house mosquito) hypothetical protein n=1 Tax=Culex pipiens TaxID=7175 RepID=A0A8D8DVL5_CULPI